ncbi:hypothetical protein EJP75_08570 [Acinetobacter baumannii]|nr:hypothetical protein EJP75_08570 [Acinetobacter baumannii]
MENYKIKVNNEAESREAQKLFFQLGYEWYGCGAAYNPIDGFKFITAYADEMRLAMGWGEDADKELTLHQLRDLVAQRKNEQGLISGADALRALADGKEVQCTITGKNEWTKDIYSIQPYYFVGGGVGQFQFRIKPRTVKIELEIPAPFDPKVGEKYWFIADYVSSGYSDTQEGTGINSSIGKWRTEEEIKQVVAALRGGIKG